MKAPQEDREHEMIAYLKIKEKKWYKFFWDMRKWLGFV